MKPTICYTRYMSAGESVGTILLPVKGTIVGVSIAFAVVNAPAGTSGVNLAVLSTSSVPWSSANKTPSDHLISVALGVPSATAATDSLAQSIYAKEILYLPVSAGTVLTAQVTSVATGYSAFFRVLLQMP